MLLQSLKNVFVVCFLNARRTAVPCLAVSHYCCFTFENKGMNIGLLFFLFLALYNPLHFVDWSAVIENCYIVCSGKTYAIIRVNLSSVVHMWVH